MSEFQTLFDAISSFEQSKETEAKATKEHVKSLFSVASAADEYLNATIRHDNAQQRYVVATKNAAESVKTRRCYEHESSRSKS